MRRALGFLALFAVASLAFAQSEPNAGDSSIAERYLSYALNAAAEGRWADAESVLDRASDYASASSDLSYYLALARSKLNRPAGAVLEAVYRALEAGRWGTRGPDDARILEAACLVRLRSYAEALSCLSACAENADVALLRIRALNGLRDSTRSLADMREAFDSYPRDPRFASLLFRSLGKRIESDRQRNLVELAIKRLPFLVEIDPSLAISAAPFIRDIEERRRLVGAFRAAGGSAAEWLPVALDLGLVGDDVAVSDLFSLPDLTLGLFSSVYGKLRTAEGRHAFLSRLDAFTGTLSDDRDGDGFNEASVAYENGQLRSFSYDADQDGIEEWHLLFAGDLPVSGEIAISRDDAGDIVPARPISAADRALAVVKWERYPFISSVAVGAYDFAFAPASFAFSPVLLERLVPDARLRIPKTDSVFPRLTERSLYSFASTLERPGTLFPGSIERIYYSRGMPHRSEERIGGRLLSIGDYSDGVRIIRRLDMDSDGRLDTVERYEKTSGNLSSVETDFDSDGVFEKEIVK